MQGWRISSDGAKDCLYHALLKGGFDTLDFGQLRIPTGDPSNGRHNQGMAGLGVRAVYRLLASSPISHGAEEAAE